MLNSHKTRMSPVIIEQDSLWWIWPMSTTCQQHVTENRKSPAGIGHGIPPMLVIGRLQVIKRSRDIGKAAKNAVPLSRQLDSFCYVLNYPMPSITHLQVPSKGFQNRCRPVKGWKNMEHLGTPECVLRCGMKDREVTQRMTNSVPTSGMLSSVRTFPRRCLRLEWNWHHLTLAYVLRLLVSLLLCMMFFLVCVCVVTSCILARLRSKVQLCIFSWLPFYLQGTLLPHGENRETIFSKWKACSFCPGETAAVPSRSHVQLEGMQMRAGFGL